MKAYRTSAKATYFVLEDKRAQMQTLHDRHDTRSEHVSRVRLALIDNEPRIHHSVQAILRQRAPQWKIDGYTCHNQAMECMLQSPPDIVLIEVSLQGVSGINLTRKLKARLPKLPVVILSERECTTTVLNAMMAGACGYFLKPIVASELVTHIGKALRGGMTFCRHGERLLLDGLHRLGKSASQLRLSSREQEIMLCLCHHHSDKEVASALGISDETVHVHLRNIFIEFGVNDRKAAVQKFLNALRE